LRPSGRVLNQEVLHSAPLKPGLEPRPGR
jgi:hypothetical protein